MIDLDYKLDGFEELQATLQKISEEDYKDVMTKNLGEIFQRAKASDNPSQGGTPVSTELTRPGGPHGELRSSLRMEVDIVGYTKEYAPHVEYGHRTRGGDYVEGQYYLQTNVEKQKEILKTDLKDAIKHIAKKGG